jgi:hypothetical protein
MDALAKESVTPTWKQTYKYNMNEKHKATRMTKDVCGNKQNFSDLMGAKSLLQFV